MTNAIPPPAPFPSFETWLKQRKSELQEEYAEDNDDFVYAEFLAWARIQYDNEVLRRRIMNSESIPPLK